MNYRKIFLFLILLVIIFMFLGSFIFHSKIIMILAVLFFLIAMAICFYALYKKDYSFLSINLGNMYIKFIKILTVIIFIITFIFLIYLLNHNIPL